MQIGLLVSFAILIFAIIGLEFYTGALHKTCYSISDLGQTAAFVCFLGTWILNSSFGFPFSSTFAHPFRHNCPWRTEHHRTLLRRPARLRPVRRLPLQRVRGHLPREVEGEQRHVSRGTRVLCHVWCCRVQTTASPASTTSCSRCWRCSSASPWRAGPACSTGWAPQLADYKWNMPHVLAPHPICPNIWLPISLQYRNITWGQQKKKSCNRYFWLSRK